MSLINTTKLPRLNTTTLDDALSWLRRQPRFASPLLEPLEYQPKSVRFSDQTLVFDTMESFGKKKSKISRESKNAIVKNPGELFAFSFVFNPDIDKSFNEIEDVTIGENDQKKPVGKETFHRTIRRWLKRNDRATSNCRVNLAYENNDSSGEQYADVSTNNCFLRRFVRSFSRTNSTDSSATSKQSIQDDENDGK